MKIVSLPTKNLKMKSVLTVTFILFFFCVEMAAQDNPFMKMAEMKYAEYSRELAKHFDAFDTVKAQNIVQQLEEVAQKTGNAEWKLQAEFGRLVIFEIKRVLLGNEQYPAEKLLNMAFELLEKTKKMKIVYFELMTRQKIIYYYWNYLKKYELAFEQYDIQEKLLQHISSDDIPEKAAYYKEIADAHYHFKDYAKAFSYYNIVLNEKNNEQTKYAKQHARNGLGLIYSNDLKDYDRSDSCYRSIIEATSQFLDDDYQYTVWQGIAEGNLGHNMMMREKYEEAVPLFKNSIEKTLKHHDYAYASGTAINLANSYLKQNNMVEAKQQIDLAIECYKKMPREGRLPNIYEALSKYYAAIGNSKLAITYMDSTLTTKKKMEEQFNTLQLMRVEQRKHLSEQQLKDEQLSGYRRNFAIAVTGLLLICGGWVRYFLLYRKKKSAYHELVRKSQEWAMSGMEHGVAGQARNDLRMENEEIEEQNSPDKADRLLMEKIEELFENEKIYYDVDLSIDILAQKLNTNRNYVSAAINHCMKKNFNTFINEYRVKEAIQMMSKSDSQLYSIDHFAYSAGFNDRKNFYRVFKKITGLSPTEFRANMG
jgi:YesN/AraC family two-component response regulator